MRIVDPQAVTLPPGVLAEYVEQLRTDDMSVGTYVIQVGGVDDQQPHREDEVYVVMSGSGRFTSGGTEVAAEAGAVLFVPAFEEHRFHDVTEDLRILVFFAPPYTGRIEGDS